MTRLTRRWRVRRHRPDGSALERADLLAGEEPLEIRVDGRPFSVTMRTPGADVDLVAGFLLSESVITGMQDIDSIDDTSGVAPEGTRDRNVVDVRLAPGVPAPDPSLERHVYTSSSCGICGTASIEAVRKVSRFPLTADGPALDARALAGLPDRLREEQEIFGRTGGVHAAGLYDTSTTSGQGWARVGVREDVGRHNAVDKVIGAALRAGSLPLRTHVLQVSGRASFELVQKAAMAGVPVLSAVSAPSSLAAQLADELGLTLIGFNRGGGFNVYTGEQRLTRRS